MRRQIFLLAVVGAASAGAAEGGMHLAIEDGDLVFANGTRSHVGKYASQLQQVIDSFPTVSTSDIKDTSYFNSSVLRYLDLSGDYFVDTPLQLPSLFVLNSAAATLSLAENATGFDSSGYKFPALVILNRTSYSAILGGTFQATNKGILNGTWQAIYVADGSYNSVRDVNAQGEFWAIIQVQGGTRNEIATSRFDGGNIANRCIWTIATSAALVSSLHA